jgi:glycosyltransferase involved in cell wall biosynthesis
VHLAGYGGPYPGSFVPMLRTARTAVEARGWSFEAVFPAESERHGWFQSIREEGMAVRAATRGSIGAASAQVTRLVRERPARTLLHTHFSIWDMPAAAAGWATAATVVWHLHSPLEDSVSARARNAVRFGVIGRSVQRILCVGPEIRSKAVARLAAPARTEVFVNGVDTARFATRRAGEREAARAALGVAPDAAVLLLFGWDWQRKGGPLLLETVRELRRRGSEVVALIVGANVEAREEARQFGVETAVQMSAPQDDARLLYTAADVFIAASTAEGMPFAMLEALACGTPVIASAIPSHRFAQGSLPACRVVERRGHAFADAVTAELAADPADRAMRLQRSRAEIEREYSLTRWSERLTELYDHLLR